MSEASHVEGLVTMLLYLAGLNLMEGELTISYHDRIQGSIFCTIFAERMS